MKKLRFALIAVLLSIYGCSSSYPGSTSPVAARDGVVADRTVSPTATPVRNLAPATQTMETRIAPTSRPTMTRPAPTQKVEILGDTPLCSPSSNENNEIPGVLFYQEYEYNGLHVVGGESFQTTKNLLPSDDLIHVFGVSPDGNWLAYSPIPNGEGDKLQQIDPMIVLLGADGEKIEHVLSMDWPKKVDQDDYELERFINGYWLNNDLIFTYINSKTPETPSPLRSPQIGLYLPVVFDPFQGRVQTGPLDILLPINGLYGYSISPDLKRILSFDNGMTLKEITEPKSYTLLWRAETGMFTTVSAMRWSPDGKWVVFNIVANVAENPFRTILVSKDGRTVIELHHPLYEDLIKEYLWSPDSKYLAFVRRQSNTLFDLLVFDVENMRSILECPLVVQRSNSHPLDRLIWSPDSAWIAVSTYEEPFQLVNIHTKERKDFGIIGSVVGWSDQFKSIFE